jgi:hypothetical protein
MDMPFDSKWRDRLNAGFQQMTNVRDGLTTVEFDDSWTTAALIEWGHELFGELSQMFKEIADLVGLRDFDESVPIAIVDAAENADKAANDLLVAAVALKTKHEVLFRLKASKGVDPIAS